MYVNEPYKLSYSAVDYVSGKPVNLIVERPDGVTEGLFLMIEDNPSNFTGVYKYEYTPTIEGKYLFKVFENSLWKATYGEYAEIKLETEALNNLANDADRVVIRFD